MSFENIISYGIDFFNSHTILAIALIIAIIVFAFWKPKGALKVTAFIIIMAAVVYVIGLFSGFLTSEVEQEDDLIHKTERVLDDEKKTDRTNKTD